MSNPIVLHRYAKKASILALNSAKSSTVRRVINQIAVFTRIDRQIKHLVGPTFSLKTEVLQLIAFDHG